MCTSGFSSIPAATAAPSQQAEQSRPAARRRARAALQPDPLTPSAGRSQHHQRSSVHRVGADQRPTPILWCGNRRRTLISRQRSHPTATTVGRSPLPHRLLPRVVHLRRLRHAAVEWRNYGANASNVAQISSDSMKWLDVPRPAMTSSST